MNWGVLALGLVLFYIGCLFMLHFARQYKKSKDKDRIEVIQGIGCVMLPIAVVIGALLFFFTGLVKIGVPLWIGCTLSIVGILLFFTALIGGLGLPPPTSHDT